MMQQRTKINKRFITSLLAVMLCLSLWAFPAAAESFSPTGSDFTLDIDTGMWYVFTPDNIVNNPELEELGISYENISEYFKTGNTHMNAILYYGNSNEYLELVVASEPVEDVENLGPCTREELEEFTDGFYEELNGTYREIWENDYNFAIVECQDEVSGIYGRIYSTIVNGKIYNFSFTNPEPLDSQDREYAKQIMETIRFQVNHPDRKYADIDFFSSVIGRASIGAVGGGIIGGVCALMRKKSTKKKTNTEEQGEQP